MKQYIVKYQIEGEIVLDVNSDVEDVEEEAFKRIHNGEIGEIKLVEINSIEDVEDETN